MRGFLPDLNSVEVTNPNDVNTPVCEIVGERIPFLTNIIVTWAGFEGLGRFGSWWYGYPILLNMRSLVLRRSTPNCLIM